MLCDCVIVRLYDYEGVWWIRYFCNVPLPKPSGKRGKYTKKDFEGAVLTYIRTFNTEYTDTYFNPHIRPDFLLKYKSFIKNKLFETGPEYLYTNIMKSILGNLSDDVYFLLCYQDEPTFLCNTIRAMIINPHRIDYALRGYEYDEEGRIYFSNGSIISIYSHKLFENALKNRY